MVNAKTTINTGRDGWVLVFLEDGRHFLSGGREEIIRQWRVDDGTEVADQRLTASGLTEVSAIALSGDGNWIVTGGWQSVSIFNRRTRQCTSTAKEHSAWVLDIDVSPDSTKFATASRDCKAIIWNIANGRPHIVPLQHGNHHVSSVRFSPDGNRIATAEYGGEPPRFPPLPGPSLGQVHSISTSYPPEMYSGTFSSTRGSSSPNGQVSASHSLIIMGQLSYPTTANSSLPSLVVPSHFGILLRVPSSDPSSTTHRHQDYIHSHFRRTTTFL
ncbi:WD40 repeat-like protein [Imleria badia]|nr:WD40 repeat-like protein [Imleria badia]